ncbi:MAG: DsrE family protein [Planctomycetaceae bacterium]|nr:DsrE family protein [Planctomycetales bacterium]MCB9927492.1 DsrE family protein [Planctomycetaceae bacterium]
MPGQDTVVIMLTVGKADNGKAATLAFSCALSALALDCQTTVFLTSDGSVWGYQGSASGIVAQGFPPLQTLIDDFLASDGRLLLCSVCHKTCGNGGPDVESRTPLVPGVSIAGFTTAVQLATQGASFTF